MPGGLIQLVKKGVEDAYFTAKPEAAVWRGAFRRVSNFAIEPLRMSWRTDPSFGGTCTLAVDRLGDLLAGVVAEVTVRKLAGSFTTAAYFPIEALFKEVVLRVDGVEVDRHTSDWFRVYNTMHRAYDASQQYTRMANFDPEVISSGAAATQTFMFPLAFSFCRSPGGALPLVALPFSEVTLQFTLASAADCGLDASVLDVRVFGEYVFVDAEERRDLATRPYDLLVEQVQVKTFTLPDAVPSALNPTTFTAKFTLTGPVKSLYFFLRNEFDGSHGRYIGDPATVPLALTADVSTPSGLCLVAPLPDSLAPITDARLSFDDAERTPQMKFLYFNRMLPLRHCAGQPVPGVGYFGFGLDPESPSPQGTCNFSVIREVRLDLTMKRNASLSEPNSSTAARDTGDLRTLVVLAWGFNVLKVRGGRGALAFL